MTVGFEGGTTIDGARAILAEMRLDIAAHRTLLRDPLGGLEDFVRVGNGVADEKEMRNLAEQAAAPIRRRLQIFEDLEGAIAGLERALDVLEGDQFPQIPQLALPRGEYRRFTRNLETMSAALALLQPFDPADGGEVRFGSGRPKDADATDAGAV